MEEEASGCCPVAINGARLLALKEGALFWPERALLVLADLHLEKGSSFAARGSPLPPYDTRATLARVEALIAAHSPRRILALGDSAHDAGAEDRMAPSDARILRRLVDGREWIWILGNHDPEPPSGWGGSREPEWREGNLIFRHETLRDRGGHGEISGHFHPKACVWSPAARAVRRCFVTNGRRLIMPAFGAYAGGLDALDPAIDSQFPGGFIALLLGAERVHPVRRGQLVAIGA